MSTPAGTSSTGWLSGGWQAPGAVARGVSACVHGGTTVHSTTQEIFKALRWVLFLLMIYYGFDIFSVVAKTSGFWSFHVLTFARDWSALQFYKFANFFVTNKYPLPELKKDTRPLFFYIIDEFTTVGTDVFKSVASNWPNVYAWIPTFVVDFCGWALGVAFLSIVIPTVGYAALYWLAKFYERITARPAYPIGPSFFTVTVELLVEAVRLIWTSLGLIYPHTDLNLEWENIQVRAAAFGSCIRPRYAATWVGSRLAPPLQGTEDPQLTVLLDTIIYKANDMIVTATASLSASNQKFSLPSLLRHFRADLSREMRSHPNFQSKFNSEFHALENLNYRTDLLHDTLHVLQLKSSTVLPDSIFFNVHIPDIENFVGPDVYVFLSSGHFRSNLFRMNAALLVAFEFNFIEPDVTLLCGFPSSEPISQPSAGFQVGDGRSALDLNPAGYRGSSPVNTSIGNAFALYASAIPAYPSMLRANATSFTGNTSKKANKKDIGSGDDKNVQEDNKDMHQRSLQPGPSDEDFQARIAEAVNKIVKANLNLSKKTATTSHSSNSKKSSRHQKRPATPPESSASESASASQSAFTSASASRSASATSSRSASATSSRSASAASRASSSASSKSRSNSAKAKHDTKPSRSSTSKNEKLSSKDKATSSDKNNGKHSSSSRNMEKSAPKDTPSTKETRHRSRSADSKQQSSESTKSTKKDKETSRPSTPSNKRSRSSESSSSKSFSASPSKAAKPGKAAATFVLQASQASTIPIVSVDPNDCWVLCCVVVLHNIAKRAGFLYHDTKHVPLEDPAWAAANGAAWVTECVSLRDPDVKGQPFCAKNALATCMDSLAVSASTKKKDRVANHFRLGSSTLKNVSPFCKLEFYDKGESTTHGRHGRKYAFARENHWTVFTGNHSHWFSAEDPSIDQRVYNEPDAVHYVWHITNAPTPSRTTPASSVSHKRTASSRSASADGSPAAKVSFAPDEDAPADPSAGEIESAERTPFKFPHPTGSITAVAVNSAETEGAAVDGEEEPTTIDSEEANIFRRCTAIGSECDSAKGVSFPASSNLVDRDCPLPSPEGDLAQRLPLNDAPSTPNLDSLPTLDQGGSLPQDPSAHHATPPLPRHESSLGAQVLASSNVLPRTHAIRRRHEESWPLPREQRRHLPPAYGERTMAFGQEGLVQGGTSAPTDSSIGVVLRGHQARGAEVDRSADPGLPHPALASLRSQGGRRQAPDQRRHTGAEWSNHRLDSPGQGRPGSQGTLPSGLELPDGVEARTRSLPGRPSPGWRQVPVSQGAWGEFGNQQRAQSRQPFPLHPLGSSGLPSNHREGRVGGRSHAHADVGTQESGDATSLPRLGSHQRTLSLQGAAGSAKSLQGTDGVMNRTVQAPRSKNSAYTLSHAMKFKVPPSTAVIIAGATGSAPVRGRRSHSITSSAPLRLHVTENLKRINLQKLHDLSSIDPSADIDLAIARRYLEDPTAYSSFLPRRTARDCSLARGISEADSELLLKAGIVEFVEDESEVMCDVDSFTTAEAAKGRARFITHPVLVNACVPAAPTTVFRPMKDRCQLVHHGRVGITIDLRSFYHQLALTKEVGNFFCFRVPTPQGPRLVRLTVAPTGGSHIVFTAVSCTSKLLSFAKSSNDHDSHVDNILFVGDTDEAVISDVRIIADRAREVGATFNEDVAHPEKLVSSKIPWVGIMIDFANKCVSITEKTSDKLALSWSLRDSWTNRGFAAHLGLLMYASQILDSPVCNFFNVLRFTSRLGMLMHDSDHTQWDQPIILWPCVLSELASWTDFTLKNEPYPVIKESSPTLLMAVDSCADGWGYVALDEVTGKMWTYGEPWSSSFSHRYGAKLGESVFTEPRGIILAKLHALHLLQGSRVLCVGSDNVASRATLSRRYCYRSYFLNEAARIDRLLFPRVPTDYVEVPGVLNTLADDRSRHFSVSLPGELSDLFVTKDPLSYTPPSTWDSPRIVVIADSDNKHIGNTTTTDLQKDSLRRLLGVFPGGSQSQGVGNAAES